MLSRQEKKIRITIFLILLIRWIKENKPILWALIQHKSQQPFWQQSIYQIINPFI